MTLLWLDLETTGLNPTKDHILEIAWTLTHSDLVPMFAYDPVYSAAVKTDIKVFDALADDYVREMHTKTGLIERMQSDKAITRSEAERDIVRSLDEALTLVDEPIYLAGASVHFDLAFIKFWMPSLAKRLSHRVYDTSTLKAFFAEFIAIPSELANQNQHNAQADVTECLKIARHFRSQIDFATQVVSELTHEGVFQGSPEAGWEA